MSVYVDDMRAEFGEMTMCHMIADTRRELMEMVDKIGVQRKWIQRADTYQEHFDICLSKRKLAVREGAVELTQKELVRRMVCKRDQLIALSLKENGLV